MTVESPYSDLVLRYFDDPPCAGSLDAAQSDVFTGSAGTREAGLQVRFEAKIREGTIDAMAFQAYACPHIIAACSLIAERLGGQGVNELDRLDVGALMTELAIPVEKTGRLLIVQDALHDCLRAWDNRRLAGN